MCFGNFGKKTRLTFTIIGFLGLAASHIFAVHEAWPARSDPYEVERYEKNGLSYIYVTNVMATITAMMILFSILSVVEICFFPDAGCWMLGGTLSLVVLHIAWVGFWGSCPDKGFLVIVSTFPASLLFLIGGYLFEFVKGFVLTAAVSFAFIGSITLSQMTVPGDWRVVANSNGATSRLSVAIACLFFSGVTAVAALLIGYLPYRFNKCCIGETLIVVLLGLASAALAGGAGGALLTLYRNQLASNSESECSYQDYHYDWCTNIECCRRVSGVRFEKLKTAVWGFLFGSFALALVALICVLRAATVQFCLPFDAEDYLEIDVYDEGELVKTVRTYKYFSTPWDEAVRAGTIVIKD